MDTSCGAAAAASVGNCLVCIISKFPGCKLQNFAPETVHIDNFCKGIANRPPPPPHAAAELPTGGNVCVANSSNRLFSTITSFSGPQLAGCDLLGHD